MAKTSPTARTLAALRKQGARAGVVEKWNSHAKIRQDLFGFLDLIAIRDGRIVGIQATSGSNVSARIAKIRANENLAPWLAAGGLVEVWGWALRGARGERKLWAPRVVNVT